MRTGDTVWFLNTHITVQLSAADNKDGISVLLLTMAKDDAPPLHVHHAEDEVFHLIEGEVRFSVGGRPEVARGGQTVLAPQGVPHGFRVVSEAAQMLCVTTGGFEHLVAAMSRPALHGGPPPHTMPTPEMQVALAAECRRVNIDLLGPPID